MPTIRRRFNYGVVTLAPHIVAGHSLACGQTVNVRLRDDFRPTHFGGFIDIAMVDDSYRRVKIEGISAYCPGEDFLGSGFTTYCGKTLMLGAYHCQLNSVFLVLDSEWPIAWCELPPAQNEKTPAE